MSVLTHSVTTSGNVPARVRKTAPGFAQLSHFLASDPDLQIYRRFNGLASRNLAYLQSELRALQAEIESIDETDKQEAEIRGKDWMENQLPARCWEVLERKANHGSSHPREAKRMELVRRLRSLMAEYQDALIRQSRVLALESPPNRCKDTLGAWIQQRRPLVGHSYDIYDDTKDLVALRSVPDDDRLTSFLQNHLGYYLRTAGKEDDDDDHEEATYFSDRPIKLIVAVLSVAFSAFLLIGAIVALYFAQGQGQKLGLTALFTTMFAASIALLTNARKTEVYASTAAYAAVLVVYVSNGSTAQRPP